MNLRNILLEKTQRVVGVPYTCFIASCVTKDGFIVLEKHALLEDLISNPKLLWVLDDVSKTFLEKEYPQKFKNMVYTHEISDPALFKKFACTVFKGKTDSHFKFASTHEVREWTLLRSMKDKEPEQEGFKIDEESMNHCFVKAMSTPPRAEGFMEMYIPRMVSISEEQEFKEKQAEKEAEQPAEPVEILQ